MLEGLEVSVLNFSEALLDNEKFRLDSEFFSKVYLDTYTTIKEKPHVQIGQIEATLSDFSANGSYATIAQNFKLLDDESYAYMVRSTDLEASNFKAGVKYVDEHAYNFLEKSKLYGGELLINKIGSPGRAYLMPKLNRPVSLGMNLFFLRLNKNQPISEIFLWAYFNTNFGQKIVQRKVNGTVPLTIDKVAVRSLYVPLQSKTFIEYIESLYIKSEKYLKKSKQTYTQAETLLLAAVSLQDFQPSNEGVNIKSFADSFGTSGRLDAEYYQPKYEQVVKAITAQKHDVLDGIVNITKSIEPGSANYDDEGLPFLRVADYSKFGLTKPHKHLKGEFVLENKGKINQLKPKKGTILFSKDGSVGTAYHLREDFEGITSGAILHLSVKNQEEIIPEYLTLVLNSQMVQMQAERDAGGSIILHWRVSEIENVVIPIIDITKQQQIAALVEQSFALKDQSEHLLEVAKRAVEIAIEEDESVAMAYVEKEVDYE